MAAPMDQANFAQNNEISAEMKVKIVSIINYLMEVDEIEDRELVELVFGQEYDILGLITLCKSLRDKKEKIGLYAEVTIYQQLDIQWATAFRMQWSSVEKLCRQIAPFIPPTTASGRCAVPLDKQVLMLLYWLAHQEQFRLLGDCFNVSESTAHSLCHRLIDIINRELTKKFIKWPDAERQRVIANFYETVMHFPGVIGSIDGTHIEINKPKENESDFYNRKLYHSIILQGVCDHELILTNINVGAPGRCHDKRVFRRSALAFQQGEDITKYFAQEEYHLLGDSAYDCRSFLLVPFTDLGNLSDSEKKFNKRLSSCRSDIERCFGRIKNRFKKLKYIQTSDWRRARDITHACCILHNFCILVNDKTSVEEDDMRGRDDGNDPPNNDVDDEDDGVVDRDGPQKRAVVMRLMGL